MRFLCAITLIILSVTTLYAQEFIRNSTIHFKDSTTKKGDFYYYPTLDQSVTLIDSLGNKQVYVLALIDYIEGKNDLYRVLDFNGKPKLLDAVIEGEKVSLYKTNFTEDIQFYVLKDNKVTWLEGGQIDFKKDGKDYRRENTKYKGTLKYLLSDNGYVVNTIDEISYFEKSITPVIIAYNDGQVSFFKTKAIERQNRIPNLKVYAQYGNQQNFVEFIDLGRHGVKTIQVGGQYYFSEASRHSFKVGLEYNQYELENGTDANWWNLSTCYRYDTFRMPKHNIYFGVKLLDIYWQNGFYDEDFHIYTRLVPFVGYERHISRKLDLYVELHNMFSITNIPYNYAFGISYDL